MRVLPPIAAALLCLSATLSAQAKPPPPRVSAAQVHRACENPHVATVSKALHRLCALPISGPVDWEAWKVGASDAAELAQAVVRLQTWSGGEMPAHALVHRLFGDPGAEALAVDIHAALQLHDPARFAAAVAEDAPAVARRAREWARVRPAPGSRRGLNYSPAVETLDTEAAAVIAQAVNAPLELATALAAQPAAVQSAVLAPFTAGLTIDQFLDQHDMGSAEAEIRARAEAQAQASAFDPKALAAALPLNQQSAIVWGVTDFVVGKAEQQVQTYFLQQFSSGFCQQYQGVLPASCGILNGDALRAFRPGLGMLRQAVRQDMEALPATVLRTAIARNAIPAQHWDAVNVTASGALFAVDVLRGTDPVHALRRIADSIISEHQAGIGAPVSRLLGQFAAVQSGLLDRTGNVLNPLPEALPAEQQVQRLLLAFAINQPAHWPSLGFTPERLARVSAELLPTVKQYRVLKDNVVQLQRTLADTAAALRTARQAYAIATSQMADVVLEAATGAGLAEAGALRASVAPLRAIATSLVNADYTTAALSTFQLVAPYREHFKTTLPAGGIRMFSFVADLAQAENPAAVSAALTRFAGSGGDFQAKRTVTTSVRFTVNAYLGLYGGGWGSDAGRGWGEELDDGRAAPFAGAYLPVGVEATLPQPRFFGGRFGVFLQAVDVGALASVRLGDDAAPTPADSVQGPPEVGFAQVFSPGVGLVYHLPRIPWSVGYLYSYSPRLRTLGAKSEERTSDVVRGGLFIAFDVPLFP
jgi:hypothetical protein